MTQALTKSAAVQNPGLNLFDVPPQGLQSSGIALCSHQPFHDGNTSHRFLNRSPRRFYQFS